MAQTWKTACKGIRYREHPTRKHGIRADRYYCLQYRRFGKVVNEAIGWASDGFTQAEAERLLAKLRENWRTGEGPQTLAEMRDASAKKRADEEAFEQSERKRLVSLDSYFENSYKEFALRSKKHDTALKEFSIYSLWLKPIFGDTPIVQIDSSDWSKLLRPIDKKNLSISTRRHICGTLCRILKHAQLHGHNVYIPTMKSLGISYPTDNRRTRVVTDSELKLILSTLLDRDILAYRLVLFAALTGCRFSEAASLKWADISEDFYITFKKTKNKHNRTIPASNSIIELFNSIGRKNNSDLVFPNHKGEQYTEAPQSFRKIIIENKFNEGRDEHDRISFHSLRHTVATKLGKNLDIRSLMDTLGWIHVTMAARYMHGDEERKKKALNMIGSMLEEKNPTKTIKFDASEDG